MVTYVNDLRLSELATGEGSGTWGTTTNTNLELIGEALGYGTEQSFSSDADATTTIGDGVSDPARAMYFKVTSAGSLTATRTLTIAPNTVSRVMFIENATTGSQSIAISQGSGANVTIATGKTAVVYLDGAGSGAAVVDAMALVDPGVTDTLAEVLAAGNTTGGNDIVMSAGDNITNASGDLTIDVAGSLKLDADSSNIYLADGGTDVGLLSTNNQDLNIRNLISDKDIYFQGNDGGSTITALTLNMSEAGEASFNSDVLLGDSKVLRFGADQDFRISFDGSNGIIQNVTGDSDIVFKGKDNTSIITALTLDMSDAGAATFNAGATFGGEVLIPEKLSHVGDTDTHFKFAGANDIRIVAGDVEHAAFDGTIVFNQSGSATMDLRIEGDTNANMLYVDASADKIGVATNAPESVLDILATKTTALSSMAHFLTLGLSVDDATAYDNAGLGGGIAFRGKRNSSGTQTVYGAIDAGKEDAANDSYKGSLRFYTNNNSTGVPTKGMTLNSSGSLGIGVADGDVTSDGTAARTYVGIIGTANRGRLNLGTTASNGADAGTLSFTNGANELVSISVDTTSGVQNTGTMYINGTRSIKIQAASSDEVVFNEGSTSSDFRVESTDNANMIKLDGTNNRVGIGKSPASNPFEVAGYASFDSGVSSAATGTTFNSSAAGGYLQVAGSSSNFWAMGSTGGTGAPTSASTSFGLHNWNGSSWSNPFSITNSGAATFTNKTVISAADGVCANDYVAAIKNLEATDGQSFGLSLNAGSNSNDIALNVTDYNGANGLLRVFGSGAVTVNGGGQAGGDFTVLSDNNANMLFVDAGADRFMLGGSTQDAGGTFAFNSGSAVIRHVHPAGTSKDNLLFAITGANNGFQTTIDGSNLITYKFHTGGNVEAVTFGTSESAFNQPGTDRDFRVESAANSNAIFLDAGQDVVSLGAANINGAFVDNQYVGLQIGTPGVDNFGGHMFMSQTAVTDTWMDIVATHDDGATGVYFTIHAVRTGDQNRSYAATVRFAYDDTFNIMTVNSQNATVEYRVSGNVLQYRVTTAGPYFVNLTVMAAG